MALAGWQMVANQLAARNGKPPVYSDDGQEIDYTKPPPPPEKNPDGTDKTPTPPKGPPPPDRFAVAGSWRRHDMQEGQDNAYQQLYLDPEMMHLEDMRKDLAKGYSGNTLGSIRQAQNAQVDGAQRGYMNQLASKTARAGIGGARAVAMQSAADQGFLKQRQSGEAEQAMLQEKAVKEGQQSLQDYMMKRKFGVLAGGQNQMQVGANERAGIQAAAAANKSDSHTFLGMEY